MKVAVISVKIVGIVAVDNEKGLNMSMKFKKANGQVFYLPTEINCSKFHTEVGDDGFIKRVRCVARKRKAKCKTCSLNK